MEENRKKCRFVRVLLRLRVTFSLGVVLILTHLALSLEILVTTTLLLESFRNIFQMIKKVLSKEEISQYVET